MSSYSSVANFKLKKVLVPARILTFTITLLIGLNFIIVINSKELNNTKIGAFAVLLILFVSFSIYMLSRDFENRFGDWWLNNMMITGDPNLKR